MEQASLVRQPVPAHAPPAAPPGAAQAASGAQVSALEPDVQAHLGRQLRAVYDEMASQPVPDRFIELLDALERKSRKVPESVDGGIAATTKAGGV